MLLLYTPALLQPQDLLAIASHFVSWSLVPSCDSQDHNLLYYGEVMEMIKCGYFCGSAFKKLTLLRYNLCPISWIYLKYDV